MIQKNKLSNRNSFITSRYGWIIVFISALTLFFSGPGQTFNVSVFIDSYIKSEGWSRSAISGFYSIATLSAGFLMPFTGKFIDKKGHRFMTPIISVCLALACLWMSFMSNIWMLLIGFLMIRLFGQGSMTLLATTLIPKWFLKKQGIALSLAAVGGVIASAVIPIISNHLILNYGTVFAWRFWAVGLVVLMTPIGILFLRNRPEDIGMAKDGQEIFETDTSGPSQMKGLSAKYSGPTDVTPKEATKSRIFWMMIFCMLVPSMINTGIVFHIVSIFAEKGFPSTFAAMILGLTAAVQFPVTFIAGWVCDRFPVYKVKAFNYIVLAVAMLVLVYSRSQMFLLVYAFIHGVFMGFDGVSTSVWWPETFGLAHLGTIRGMGMTAMVIGSALGPLPFGFAFDTFGNYSFILLIMLTFPTLAFFASITSSPQRIKS